MKLRALHAIEVSSRCNLSCVYCPNGSKVMKRPRLDMSEDVFVHALHWLAFFGARGTQVNEVHFSGIGESLLHPRLAEYLEAARALLPKLEILLSTNGLLLTDELAARLAPSGAQLMISLHAPVRAAEAIAIGRRHGIVRHAAQPASTEPHDWAGQVEWAPGRGAPRAPCTWLQNRIGFVAADGRILRCCFDTDGASTIGNVMDPPTELDTGPWSLCASCNQDPGA